VDWGEFVCSIRLKNRKLEVKSLHYTSPPENLVHNMVALPQEQKCGLKYVIHSLGKTEGGAYNLDSASCDKSALASINPIW
jgi:hypothetical protein